MSYLIFGRAIKNEFIALGVLSTALGGAILATRGGGKAKPATNVQAAKASVPIKADSSEEEQFIQKFIEEAEKEGAGAGAGH